MVIRISTVSLAFEGTGFTGTIPTRIGRLRHLQSLMLQRTSLSGTLPSELAQCTSLVNLNVLGLQLYGTIPTEYATLNKLGRCMGRFLLAIFLFRLFIFDTFSWMITKLTFFSFVL